MSTTKKKTTSKKEPVEETASATEAADAAAEILAKSDNLLMSQDSIVGASPEHSASHNPSQRDFIRGTRDIDPTYIPDRCYDEIADCERAVALKNDYHYVWVTDTKINQFKIRGYKFALYDGGNQSGLATGGLRGTYLFERTIDNHVRNGDVFLMWAPRRLYEALVAEDKAEADKWESAAENDVHNLGYRYGVRTFKEKDGQTIYN
jgi:hypothetical protein